MRELYFSCIYCGKSLAVDEGGEGRVIRCVDCGYEQVVPEGEKRFECGGCGVEHIAAASASGSRVRCVRCGREIIVPEFVGGGECGGGGIGLRRILRGVVGVVYYCVLIGIVAFLVWVMIKEEGDGTRDVLVEGGFVDEGVSNRVVEISVAKEEVYVVKPHTGIMYDVKTVGVGVVSGGSGIVVSASNVVIEISEEQLRREERKMAEELFKVLRVGVSNVVKMSYDYGYNQEESCRIRRLREMFYLYLAAFNENGFSKEFSRQLGRVMRYSFAVEFVDGESSLRAMEALIVLLESIDSDVERFVYLMKTDFVRSWARRDYLVAYKVLEGIRVGGVDIKKEARRIRHLWDQVVHGIFDNEVDSGRREKYLRGASGRFFEYLVMDDVEDINDKVRDLIFLMMKYKTYGEVEGLCGILDKILKRYGDRIVSSEFYHMRMMLALDGEGDWERAEDSLMRMRRLVRGGLISTNDWGYQAAMRVYYKDFWWPGYEIARRYSIRMKSKEEERRSKKL